MEVEEGRLGFAEAAGGVAELVSAAEAAEAAVAAGGAALRDGCLCPWMRKNSRKSLS